MTIQVQNGKHGIGLVRNGKEKNFVSPMSLLVGQILRTELKLIQRILMRL